ncbi:MAG: NAD(P)H-hydrate dehydratase [Deltaproteobacteria bacterium]|nr:NAD(P)H-hydrate dehydratase [Deltaproteobacteria bacterium]
MKVVSAAQMRQLDAATISAGVPALRLMECAGKGLADTVQHLVAPPARIGLLLGSGNNAGDGCVAARYLQGAGYQLRIFLTSDPATFSPDAATNWQRLPRHECEIVPESLRSTEALTTCTFLIDALLGTGLTRSVQSPLHEVIVAANASGVPIVSADLPSGLSADTGMPLGVAIRAQHTVTFGLPKLGHLLGEAADYVGRLHIVDIGIPSALVTALADVPVINGPEVFAAHWPARRRESHKGDYGAALVIAGSRQMPGAGYMASRAALRMGCGTVTYALPEQAYTRFDLSAVEVMMAPCADDGSGFFTPASLSALRAVLQRKEAIAIGPGVGREEATRALFLQLLPHCASPLVVDADALWALADAPSVWSRIKVPWSITPHPGEMARLMGITTEAVQHDRLAVARTCAERTGAIVVLKGARTVIAAPDGSVWINPTGNSGMATAGSGDVLTGMIVGLLAQGMATDHAAAAAVYLHGIAGDLAIQQQGEEGLIAADLIATIPAAIIQSLHAPREPIPRI